MGRIYYILSSGVLRRRENTIVLEGENRRKFIPVENVEALYVFGEVSVNTKLLNLLNRHGVVVHFFNYYGWYIGSFYPRERNVSGFLAVKQVEHYLDPDKRLFLAKAFVRGALKNLSALPLNLDPKDYLQEIEASRDVATLMSVEASFRKKFYKLLEDKIGWEFGGRSRRPPQNPLNALISFGNSLVYTTVLKEIYHTQLLPTVSYLHEPSDRRFSLSLDLAEIFKPILSDRLILRLIQNGQIGEEHFEEKLNFTYLNSKGREIFLREYDKLLRSTLRHRRLNRKVSLSRVIRLECYKLIKHLIGERHYKPFSFSLKE
ncbi:MAG: type I-B CRISPR-associated endonuclease Cas1 [Thermotogae bacterium]|nr:type I-B CRISPR-associated endonuclease Cas1 [Thermotogota bacterium]